jgi:hypothetical protein
MNALILSVVALSVADFCMSVTHWILAMHYLKTAIYIPKILRKEEVNPGRCMKVMMWVGIAVCMILAVLETTFMILYYLTIPKGIPSQSLSVLAATTMLCFQVWVDAVGIMLIVCVLKIFLFMRKVPSHQRISVKALLVHAGAFGLFLVSNMVLTTFMTLYYFDPTNNKIIRDADISSIVNSICSLIASFCIFYIFWQLGEKASTQAAHESSDFSIKSI